jgi:hypothetical protein
MIELGVFVHVYVHTGDPVKDMEYRLAMSEALYCIPQTVILGGSSNE